MYFGLSPAYSIGLCFALSLIQWFSLASPSSIHLLLQRVSKLKICFTLSLLNQIKCRLRHLRSQKTCLCGFNRHSHPQHVTLKSACFNQECSHVGGLTA